MHAHTKHERPTAKRSAATNDTSLTNDQRNTLDHAMPVHAPPYTHTSTPRAVPCAFAFAMPTLPQSAALCYPIASCAGKPNLCCEPNLRRLADLRSARLTYNTTTRTQMNDMPHAFSQSLSPACQGKKATMLQVRRVCLCILPDTTYAHPGPRAR